ncbi:MAG: VOC family protein [Pseudomonadota bacterium]
MRLEHLNVTVPDPKHTAKVLENLFDWKVRWEGTSMGTGYSVHVGDEESYLALFSPGGDLAPSQNTYGRIGGLNHVGVVVTDLHDVETKVKSAGYTPHNHADYEPGQRFYFDGPGGIEFEVVCYS